MPDYELNLLIDDYVQIWWSQMMKNMHEIEKWWMRRWLTRKNDKGMKEMSDLKEETEEMKRNVNVWFFQMREWI